jgi:hypothetical protein
MVRQRRFTDFLASPPRGWAGIISLLGFGVVGNLLAGLITLVAGTSVWQLILWILSIFAVIWGAFAVWRRMKPLVLVPEDQQPQKHRGLILLVGTGRPGEDPMSQSAGIAIKYHMSDKEGTGLERCWLIASGGERGSLPVAQELQKQCQAQNVTAHIRAVSDAFSVQESYDVILRIYEEEVPTTGLSEEEVIADFTGGVKPMSAGMILACGETRSMQYMYGRKEGIASVPRLIEFQPRRRSTRSKRRA